MGIFRKVDTGFWADAYIMSLAPDEKLVMVYMLTNTNTTVAGIYAIHKKTIAAETGIGIRRVNNILRKLENDGKILSDESTMEVAVLDWCRHNSADSVKMQEGIKRAMAEIRSAEIKKAAVKMFGDYEEDEYEV